MYNNTYFSIFDVPVPPHRKTKTKTKTSLETKRWSTNSVMAEDIILYSHHGILCNIKKSGERFTSWIWRICIKCWCWKKQDTEKYMCICVLFHSILTKQWPKKPLYVCVYIHRCVYIYLCRVIWLKKI